MAPLTWGGASGGGLAHCEERCRSDHVGRHWGVYHSPGESAGVVAHLLRTQLPFDTSACNESTNTSINASMHASMHASTHAIYKRKYKCRYKHKSYRYDWVPRTKHIRAACGDGYQSSTDDTTENCRNGELTPMLRLFAMLQTTEFWVDGQIIGTSTFFGCDRLILADVGAEDSPIFFPAVFHWGLPPGFLPARNLMYVIPVAATHPRLDYTPPGGGMELLSP
eukprot:5702823-Pyramimonas_sp.AAC.1